VVRLIDVRHPRDHFIEQRRCFIDDGVRVVNQTTSQAAESTPCFLEGFSNELFVRLRGHNAPPFFVQFKLPDEGYTCETMNEAGKKPARKKSKEGWIARHARTAREIHREPRSAITMLRSAAVGLWVARGGGFYGLGCLVAFIVLEVQMFTGDVAESTGVSDFITSQVLEFVLRIGFMSFVNGFLALIWPVYLLDWLGAPGLLVLFGGYMAFERVLRPFVERHIPELKEARAKAALKKAKSMMRKQSRR
jgi:hypothetical protein